MLIIGQVSPIPPRQKSGPGSERSIQVPKGQYKVTVSHSDNTQKSQCTVVKSPRGFAETSVYELSRGLPHHSATEN